QERADRAPSAPKVFTSHRDLGPSVFSSSSIDLSVAHALDRARRRLNTTELPRSKRRGAPNFG
ncbi:MAG: hypothetical protein VYC34_02510, partial [Planctomycetota bacterium]|nr:hypothetical protein [Planctomycetota bacterium]